jgi:hypothetical protein
LQPQRLDGLVENQPENPVRESAPHFFIVHEIDGQDRLADPAHAVQANSPAL